MKERRKDFETRLAFERVVKRMSRVQLIEAAMESYFDNLTGLPIRKALKKTMNAMENQGFLIAADLDNFKFINDTFGHEVGDEYLVSFARILNEESFGQAYRVGGDEFIITNERHEFANVIIRNIKTRLSKYTLRARSIQSREWIKPDMVLFKKGMDASFGVGHDLKSADISLYESKQKREQQGLRVTGDKIPSGYLDIEAAKTIYYSSES